MMACILLGNTISATCSNRTRIILNVHFESSDLESQDSSVETLAKGSSYSTDLESERNC